MKYQFYIFFLFSLQNFGQTNLVPNPGFETYTICPYDLGQIKKAIPWFQPSEGTPDFYNTCALVGSSVNIPYTQVGYSYAHTGGGMAGLFTMGDAFTPSPVDKYYKEYIAVRLNETLLNGQKYFVSFYMKLGNSCLFASSSIGVFFGTDSIFKFGLDTIGVTPQINNQAQNFVTSKTLWTQIKGNFTAMGTEKYLYLGNFSPALNDTLRLAPGAVNQSINYPYYFIDDICVSTDENFCDLLTGINEVLSDLSIKINPNPVTDKFILESPGNLNLQQIIIYNYIGKVVYSAMDSKTNQEIDLSFLPTGIYYLKAQYNASQKVFKIMKE